MELRQLKYFVAVADVLNFTRAANSLYIAQPTLSQQISALEAELGITLFTREHGSVALTPEAKLLVPQAKEILARATRMQDTVRSLIPDKPMEEHKLAVICPNTLARDRQFISCLTRSVRKLRDEDKWFQFLFGLQKEENLLSELNQTYDIVFQIQSGQPLSDKYTSVALSQQELQLYTWNETLMPDTRESVIKILRHRPVFYHGRDKAGVQQIVQIFAELDVSPKIYFMDDIEAIEVMIGSGDFGSAILPAHAAVSFQDPHLQHFSLGCKEAIIYLVAIWKTAAQNECILRLIRQMKEEMKKEWPGRCGRAGL